LFFLGPVTDQRVIFAGDRKSFALPLGDIISVTKFSDGFGFSDGSKTHILQTTEPRPMQVFASVLDKVLQPGSLPS
jgi:hypothetical protein